MTLNLRTDAEATEVALMAIRSLEKRKHERPQTTQTFAERFRRFRLGTPWFHKTWYAAFDNPDLLRLYVQGPREHAKTSTVLTYAIKRLCENHAIRIGIISGTDDLAKKFANEVKYAISTNEELQELYGVAPGDKWTEHELVLKDARRLGLSGKDVNLFSVGRGSQVSSRHCDILIVDDVESADSVKSDIVRQSTREYWSREVLPVLSPGGKLIATGTRKHFDDLYSYWLAGRITDDNPDGWYVLDDAKSVWREPEAIDEGTPIWPEMWSAAALRARKAELDAQDLLAWPQEYLNSPRPAGTQMFFPESWPKYTRAPQGLLVYQYWDLAISERTTADYTCGVTIGVDDRSNAYILELRRGHWDFNRTLAEIEDMGKRWQEHLAMIGIEQVAYQASAVQEATRRTMLPIVPVPSGKQKPDKPAGDKVVRARLLEARAAGNKVLRPVQVDENGAQTDPKWWKLFASEATFFPAGAHDDQVDAMSGAMRLVGWDANTTAWALGVYTCANCGHPFSWDPGRPCPKCNTRAPMTYENPETGFVPNPEAAGYGPDRAEDDVLDGNGGVLLPPSLPTPTARIVGSTLGWQEREIAEQIQAGNLLSFRAPDWPVRRQQVHAVAAWFIDTGQELGAQIALEEVKRLDHELGYTNGNNGNANGNGQQHL